MKAFIVSVNRHQLFTAGIGSKGVVGASVTWAGGDDFFHFHVGGMDGLTDEHVRWNTPDLKLGDLVTIEIVEAETFDTESERYSYDKSGRKRVSKRVSVRRARGFKAKAQKHQRKKKGT